MLDTAASLDEQSKRASQRGRHPALPLGQTLARLYSLWGLDDNWDSFGSARPCHGAIQHTTILLPLLYGAATAMGGWKDPLVSADERGDISLEWWRGERYLTLTITADDAEHLRLWELDITDELADGPLDMMQFALLWRWLNG